MTDDFGDSLLGDKLVYRPVKYRLEDEFKRDVISEAEHIFGKETLYFDLEKSVKTKVKTRRTDGLLLDFSVKPYRFWVIEYELSSHSLENHIQPQIQGFLKALRESDTLRSIQKMLFDEINQDKAKRDFVKEKIGDQEIYFFLDELLHSESGIILVIDELDVNLKEEMDSLSIWGKDLISIEFKKYVNKKEDVIYRFNPLTLDEAETDIEDTSGKPMREYPPHMTRWDARLEWSNIQIRQLFGNVRAKVMNTDPTIVSEPHQRFYYFYTDPSKKSRYLFAVVLISKNQLWIRFRLPEDVKVIIDGVKEYRGWFFSKGIEVGYLVTDVNDPVLVGLIKHAYDYTKTLH